MRARRNTPLALLQAARRLLSDPARWWNTEDSPYCKGLGRDRNDMQYLALDRFGYGVHPWSSRAVKWTIASAIARVSGKSWRTAAARNRPDLQPIIEARNVVFRVRPEYYPTHAIVLATLDEAIALVRGERAKRAA